MNDPDSKAAAGAAQSAGALHGDGGSGRPARLDAAAIAAKFAELKSSAQGLTSEEAAARLAKRRTERHCRQGGAALAQAVRPFLGAAPVDDRGGRPRHEFFDELPPAPDSARFHRHQAGRPSGPRRITWIIARSSGSNRTPRSN